MNKPQWTKPAMPKTSSPACNGEIFPTSAASRLLTLSAADVIAVSTWRRVQGQRNGPPHPATHVRCVRLCHRNRPRSDRSGSDGQNRHGSDEQGAPPAITDLDEARAMLAKAEAEPAHPVTKIALRLLALTVVRPGTLAGTPWSEWAKLDPSAPTWRVPGRAT